MTLLSKINFLSFIKFANEKMNMIIKKNFITLSWLKLWSRLKNKLINNDNQNNKSAQKNILLAK